MFHHTLFTYRFAISTFEYAELHPHDAAGASVVDVAFAVALAGPQPSMEEPWQKTVVSKFQSE